MTTELERPVMRLEDVRPHMIITHGFTRFHVADTITKMLGGKRADHERAASRILAKARKDGLIKFPYHRARSVYYHFTDA